MKYNLISLLLAQVKRSSTCNKKELESQLAARSWKRQMKKGDWPGIMPRSTRYKTHWEIFPLQHFRMVVTLR